MKICIVAHNSDAIFGGQAGGSERQVALLATHMARRGHRVVLVLTGSRRQDTSVSGVTVVSPWDPDRGVRGVRALTYRYPQLFRVLCGVKADLYYSRGASLASPVVVEAARRLDAPSIIALASDRDTSAETSRVLFDFGHPLRTALFSGLAHKIYRSWALSRATCVAVQNADQAQACAAQGLRYTSVPNIVDNSITPVALSASGTDAIWVGNVETDVRRSKGVAELLALTKSLPGLTFGVIGDLGAPRIAPLVESLQCRSNVVLTGPQSHENTQAWINRARVVVNTSPSEGFSNVMLEAWALGKPVVALHVDPNALLSTGQLGLHAGGSLALMKEQLERLLSDDEISPAIAARAYDYVRENHSPERVCSLLEALVAQTSSVSESRAIPRGSQEGRRKPKPRAHDGTSNEWGLP